MARIKVIQPEEAEGRLSEIYNEILDKRKKLADVHTIQSLRPESIVKHMELYMEIMFTRSSLTRAEREMMAVIVSKNNDCVYCQTRHGEALNHYWKNDQRVEDLKNDYNKLDLSSRELALCEFAKGLTKNPGLHEDNDFTLKLKSEGIDDAGVLDAVLVIAYFNFVNRIVLSLGVHVEEDQGKGYDY